MLLSSNRLGRLPFTEVTRVRVSSGVQILGVINLKLTGSKLSIDYGVMAHSRTEYRNSHNDSRKGDAGLRFESLLISKINCGKLELVH